MNESLFYSIAFFGILAIAATTALALFFVSAPYGRHLRKGWGPTLNSTVGWILMETPAAATIAIFFFFGNRMANVTSIVFLAMWEMHYIYRSLIFPFLRRGKKRPMPVSIVSMAILFNIWNGYLNGYWLFELGPAKELDWLLGPRFIIGAALFAAGMIINHHSDHVLRVLRTPEETEYKVPFGGLFRFVSMPNYFGELVEWTGWAVATWSPGGLAFAIFTAANLVPRAVTNHSWYKKSFPDYPTNRKAVIPFVL